MRAVIFCHSLISDWNHGNAHFLRGIVSELQERGHDVRVWEPKDSWSLQNLKADYGNAPIEQFRAELPHLASTEYELDTLDFDKALDGADLVLVHEWSEPELVARIGRHRARTSGYTLLFHDTHHRSVTAPAEMARYDLEHYDGVLAFGQSVAEQYSKRGWGRRVWVWHEAADHRIFRPLSPNGEKRDLIWIGNWGDDERTAELHEFLIEPVRTLGLQATVHGVRYPEAAKAALADAGAEYRGWIANHRVPQAFANHRFTVHVPRRPYATALEGVPTIRMFEALACGIPLISAPWNDSEGLFRAGQDFLFVENGSAMKNAMRSVLQDAELAAAIGTSGRETVLSRHTCAHRVDELFQILGELKGIGERSITVAGAPV